MPYVEAARAAAHGVTERERLFVGAIEAWAHRDSAKALHFHKGILELAPRDILNLKIAQIHQINCGDSTAMADWSTYTLKYASDVGYVWGLAAFGLEQCGHFAQAENAGVRAVEMNEDDPWAHHAVAHVMDTQGRTNEGLGWMRAHWHLWDRCSSFLYTHNWWHSALFYLDRDAPEDALALYDTRIWGVRKTHVQDQVNAVALLARLELFGVDVGARWLDLGAHLRARMHDHLNGFLDLHFLYGLARAQDHQAVCEMMVSLTAYAQAAPAPYLALWQDIVLPTAQGLLSFVAGDYTKAKAALSKARPHWRLMGGSNAQRDLFEQIYLRVLIDANAPAQAKTLLDQRLARRGSIPWEHRTLAKIYHTMAMPEACALSLVYADKLTEQFHDSHLP
jgi:tetratricopeptide (TPR) repeat protein